MFYNIFLQSKSTAPKKGSAEIIQKNKKIFKKRLTFGRPNVIIYSGGEGMAKKKRKPISDKLENALIDFLIGLLLLIIDKIIN